MRPLDVLLIIGTVLAWELARADTTSRDNRLYEVTEWNNPNEIGEGQPNTTSWTDTGVVLGGADDKESDAELDSMVCGFDDSVLEVTHDSSGRVKRYSLYASKWKKKHLYYRIVNSPHNNEAEKYRVQNTVARAIKLWSDASPLTFYEAKDGQKADFVVKFIKGDHNDGYPFDGEGGIYAHAFFPQDGDVHFDNDEIWALKKEDSPKKDLFIIAAHELGHSLGLGHSKVDGAVMRPKYRDIMKHKDIEKLSSDDTAAIQAVYGPCPKVEYWLKDLLKRRTKPRPPIGKRRPSTCSGPFDAMFLGPDMRTYVIRGRYYWKLNEERMIGRPQPLLIKHRWPGLPGNVNAAVTSYYTKRTYFFKGDRVWRYNNNVLDSNYPIKIKGTGLPKNPDAALVWGPKNRIVIFRGKKFWVWNEFTRRVDMGFPKLIRKYWHGVPNHLDAALRWKNGITYFFKSGYYWKFEDDLEKTAKCYPRPVALYWSSCGGTSLERYGT